MKKETYTKEEFNFIKKQLNIIQDKKTEDQVRKYSSSLHMAKQTDHVKAPLYKAVRVRIEEITRPPAIAVNGDMDDIAEGV